MSIDPTAPSALLNLQASAGTRSALESDPASVRRMETARAAEAFEGYLAQIMVREMRKTIPEGGLMGSHALDVFMDVLDQEISERIADSGGFGMQQALMGAMDPQASVGGGQGMLQGPEGHGRRWSAQHPVDGVVTSRFGRRADPFQDRDAHHAGMDIAAAKGSPIRAVRDGEVVFAGERSGYGRVAIVDHGDGLQTLYAHCDRLSVRQGQRVGAGQPIATVGETGRATGPHLHFEVRVDGRAVNPEGALRWR